MGAKIDAILSPTFVEELIRLSFHDKEFAKLVTENISLSNFPRELGSCKAMLKVLADNIQSTGSLATYGMVEMTFNNDENISKKIKEIKGMPIPEAIPMMQQLETFIKRQSFVALQREVAEMYNTGKCTEAMDMLEQRMPEINGFSFEQKAGKFIRVYRDFDKTMSTMRMRTEDDARRPQMPFGITSLDDISGGGIHRQDTALFIMRSGVGKSTILKYIAWYNTAIAYNHVLHIQLEGGRDEAVIKFDQMIAKTTYSKVLRGDLTDGTVKRVSALIKRSATVNSDIDVYASQEMMDVTIADLIEVVDDYKKEYGYYPDMITVDSLDLLLSGENKKIDFDPNFIKYRLQKCAQRLKDIAKKYDCAVIATAQTGDVPFEIWNDPTRVITRQHTEGDRTLVKPFSFVFTGNITIEEGKNRLARIYCDKLRNYKNNGIIVRIPTDYENGFFYDLSRSVAEERVLDISATEKLEGLRKKRLDKSNMEEVEIEPGVRSRKVIPKKIANL